MPKKRGNNEGTISQYKDGRWCARYWVYTVNGRKRKAIYGRTRKEVPAKLVEKQSDAGRGLVFDARGLRVKEYMERWLEDVVRPSKAPRTYTTHRQQVDSHITPVLGSMKLEALRKSHIDRLYGDLFRPRPEGKGLAPSTVHRIHAVLHAALENAVRGDLIPRNPAAYASKPRMVQEEKTPLDAEQVRRLLVAARNDRYEAAYVLASMAGLRRGEVLGLRWSDIDLDAGTLRVYQQLQRLRRVGDTPGRNEFAEPKNSSRRTVGLPEYAVKVLRDHGSRQTEEKQLFGSLYEDKDLVFAGQTGKPLDDQNFINRHFKPLLRKAQLPPICFHNLRHTCISLLAQHSEPIRDLQALAGHRTAAFTLQRYAHHYDSSARRTATAMGNIISMQA